MKTDDEIMAFVDQQVALDLTLHNHLPKAQTNIFALARGPEICCGQAGVHLAI